MKLRAPAHLDLEEIVTTVATRAVRWLEREGYIRDDEDGPVATDADSPWMRCLRGSLGTADLQRATEHGDERSAERRSPARSGKGSGAQYLRFNLHAGVSVPGGLPAARERLLGYCARPPLCQERPSLLGDGNICYRIKDTDRVLPRLWLEPACPTAPIEAAKGDGLPSRPPARWGLGLVHFGFAQRGSGLAQVGRTLENTSTCGVEPEPDRFGLPVLHEDTQQITSNSTIE